MRAPVDPSFTFNIKVYSQPSVAANEALTEPPSLCVSKPVSLTISTYSPKVPASEHVRYGSKADVPVQPTNSTTCPTVSRDRSARESSWKAKTNGSGVPSGFKDRGWLMRRATGIPSRAGFGPSSKLPIPTCRTITQGDGSDLDMYSTLNCISPPMSSAQSVRYGSEADLVRPNSLPTVYSRPGQHPLERH